MSKSSAASAATPARATQKNQQPALQNQEIVPE
jgi:hypothetical protein